MAGTEPKIDRELLGRVASLTRGQQLWLRTVLQAILTMEPAARRPAEEERPRRPESRPADAKPAQERRRQDLDDLLSGEEVSEEDYPDLANELKGVGDIADLLRESGRARRQFGEEILRLLEGSDGSEEDEGEEGDEGARFN